jgi:hypothetical protein
VSRPRGLLGPGAFATVRVLLVGSWHGALGGPSWSFGIVSTVFRMRVVVRSGLCWGGGCVAGGVYILAAPVCVVKHKLIFRPYQLELQLFRSVWFESYAIFSNVLVYFSFVDTAILGLGLL